MSRRALPTGSARTKAPATFLRACVAALALMCVVCLIGCGSNDEMQFPGRSGREQRAELIWKLKTGTQREPRNVRAWKELGQTLLKQGLGMIGWWDSEYLRYGSMQRWLQAERVIDEALVAFSKGMELDSSDARLYASAGHAMLKKFGHDPTINDTTRLMQAIAYLERSVAIDPKLVDGLVDLGLAWTPSWRSEGDIQRARGYIDRAMAISPENGMVHYALASLNEAEDKYQDALANLRKALRQGLNDETAYLEIAVRYERIYHALGSEWHAEWERAHTFLGKVGNTITQAIFFTSTPFPKWIEIGAGRKAIMSGSDNPKYYALVADGCRYGFGREKAADYYAKAFEQDSLVLCDQYFWYDKIIQNWLQQYVHHNPGSYYAHIALGDSYWQAYDRRDQNDSLSQKSRAEFLAAITLRPDIGSAYVRLGRTYDDPLKPEKAQEYYRKALPLRFEEARSLFEMADNFLFSKNYDEATRCYTRLRDLDLYPRPMLLYSLGFVKEKKGDVKAAHSLYLELDHTYPMAIASSWEGRRAAMSVSEAYEATGNYDKAIDVLKRSVENDRWKKAFLYYQGSPRTYAQIGRLYSKKGDSENALASYKKAILIDEESREAYLGLAEEYTKLRMRDKAIENYRTAAHLGVPAAKKALEKLGVAAEALGKR